jgi:hypothetical protein
MDACKFDDVNRGFGVSMKRRYALWEHHPNEQFKVLFHNSIKAQWLVIAATVGNRVTRDGQCKHITK